MELVVFDCLDVGQSQLLLIDPQLHQGVVLGDAVILAIPTPGADELQRIGPVILISPQLGILAIGQIVEVVVHQLDLLLVGCTRSGGEQARKCLGPLDGPATIHFLQLGPQVRTGNIFGKARSLHTGAT